MLDFLNNEIVADVIKAAIVIFILLTAFAYMTLIERRIVARLQGRLGPNRTGPFGLFQPVADEIVPGLEIQTGKRFIEAKGTDIS